MEWITSKGWRETPEEIRGRKEKEDQEKKRRKKEKRKKKKSRKSTENARTLLSLLVCVRCGSQLSLKSMRILLEKERVYYPNCGRIFQKKFNHEEQTAYIQEIDDINNLEYKIHRNLRDKKTGKKRTN